MHFLGDLCPCPGYVGLRQRLCDSRFIQPVTDQLLHSPTTSNVFPLSQTIARCGDLTPASVSPTLGCRSCPTHSPLFPLLPSVYWVFCGFMYCFLMVRDFCSLSAGVLQDILCLKVYSWCIYIERCTPCPLTPLWFLSLPFASFYVDLHLLCLYLRIVMFYSLSSLPGVWLMSL